MHDLKHAPEKIAALVELLSTSGGLRITAQITVNQILANQAPQNTIPENTAAQPSNLSKPSQRESRAAETSPEVSVELSGADTPLLLARNAELLHAIEHLAAKILRLEPEEHDRISVDAADFKANRDRDLRASATAAIARVRAEGQPYTFPPMSSRERRLLHLAIAPSGLRSASTGEGPRRSVVLYPEPA
jgi:spoIIIJ-associated protein